MSNLLTYGMIIKIIAPENDLFHNKDFFIYFISNDKIILINETDKETLTIVDKKIQDESIKEIQILNEPSEQGYVKQNNLNITNWIDIYFNGTIPVVITGQITNIEEDMIEIKTYPEEDIIYIDFKYQGLPEELNIDKIVLRSSPKEEEKIEINENREALQDETEVSSKLNSEDESFEEKIKQEENELLNENELNDIILDADNIDFLEDLDEIEYVVDVEDSRLRYSLKEQVNDLLDNLLEKIPTNQRTSEIIRDIHLLINRFKQLREKTSIFDENLNVIDSITKKQYEKPIVEKMIEEKISLKYLIKIVENKKKIYDYDDIPKDIDDIVKVNLSDERIEEGNIINQYHNNFFSDKKNPVYYVNDLIADYYRPFENKQTFNLKINVENDEDVIVNNDDNYCNMAFTINRSTDSLNKVCFNQQRYIKGDVMDLKSILFMPYPLIKYSNLFLPSINILDKSKIHLNELLVYKILKDINLNTTIIDKNTSIVTEHNHLKMINEFSFTPREDFNYSNILQKIIPSNKEIITIMKDYLLKCYNLHSVLEVLSGFYIDIDNLSDLDSVLIQKMINKNIETILLENQNASKLSKQIKYKKKKKQSNFATMLLSTSLKESLLTIYNIEPEIKITEEYSNTLTNSELLYKMCYDNWCILNNSILETNTNLFNFFTNEKIQEIYEKANSEVSKPFDDTECKETIVSKKYISLEDLEKDNDKTIYFDKIYDPTFYDIKEEYSKEQENMDYTSFKKFLTNQLIKNIGLSKENAEVEAETMINGKKEVKEGNYAILELNNNSEKNIYYYVRNKKKWTRDKTITEGVMIDKNKLLCNIKENCIQEDNDCENIFSAANHLQVDGLNKIINEYSDTSKLDKEKLESEIIKKLKKSLKNINKLFEKENREKLKKNRMQIAIGNIDIEDSIKSPYEKIRDQILNENDFIKKQQNIQKFITYYTREAGVDENENWLYCIDTDIKLIPMFFKKLAEAFLVNDNYIEVINKLCREIGTLSDDGDSWVDKHSGYIIKKIDLVNETNYTESGFKDVYTDVIEQDEKTTILDLNETKQKETSETRYIKNIINIITENMGISLDPQFIVQHTNLLLKKDIPNETKYNLKIKQILKKNPEKVIETYENYYNSSIIYITLGFLLVDIQTAIPSVKTKKTFPNCKRSFIGYPLYDEKDMSALEYISCISFKIKNLNVQPWSSISKVKQSQIQKKIKIHLDNYILKNQFVQDKINLKNKYLIENTEESIEPYLITGWKTFLPPIYQHKFKSIENVSENFKQSLREDVVKGKKDQFKKINTINGKIISYSTAIQAMINEIIKRKAPLLSNVYKEPFLENACCNDKNTSPFEYFNETNQLIEIYNNNIQELENILYDIQNNFSKAKMILYFKNTRRPVISMLEEYNEETIYKTLIKYGNFTNDEPIPVYMSKLLPIKPDMEDVIEDTFYEQMMHLKNTGFNYDNTFFKKVLQDIHQVNMKEIKTKSIIDFDKDLLITIDFLLEQTNSSIYDLNFLNFLKQSLTGQYKELNDFLFNKIEEFEGNIISFIKKNTKLSKIEYSHIEHFLKTFFTFNELENKENTINRSIEFCKTSVYNVIYLYNNILKNKNDYTDISIPSHWNLSSKHNEDIKNIIKKNYVSLVSVYGSENIDMFLKEIEKYKNYYTLVLKSPIINKINNKIPYDTMELLYKYYVLHLFNTIISINLDILVVPESEDEIKEVTFGNKKILKELICKLLTSEIETLINYKKTINYNYSTVMELVLRSKEKEKNQITTRLADMDQEQRNVNNLLKQNKLNEWNKGLQKGLVEYVADDYEKAEPLIDEEYNFKDSYFMADSDMFLNVEMAKANNENVFNLDLPAEAFDLGNLPDDDDYGDFDGDE